MASNHDICYARSDDGGRTWVKSNGEAYKLPINATTAEYAWKVPQRSELINQTSMCTDAEGRPYIATYWRDENSQIPRYRLVYHDGAAWSEQTLTDGTTAFSLSGGGTKQIPISRPQILVSSKDGQQQALLVYRDAERGDRVSIAICRQFPHGGWLTTDLTESSVGAWEPSYDTEAWRLRQELDLFVQRTAQGDGEQLTDAAPTMVSVLEWKL